MNKQLWDVVRVGPRENKLGGVFANAQALHPILCINNDEIEQYCFCT